MPRYEVTIHRAANRELTTLDSHEREQLTDTLLAVAGERKPTAHSSVKPMEGQHGLYRVRVGDLRAVVTLTKPELRVLSVGRREGMYDNTNYEKRRASA